MNTTPANNDKLEHVSGAKSQIGEKHPSYQVRFRHVNCRKHLQPQKPNGFSPFCFTTVYWRPRKANTGHPRSSSGIITHEGLKTGCCGSGEGIVSGNAVESLNDVDLAADLENIAQYLCDEQSSHIRGVVSLREYIIWDNGPPISFCGSGQIIHNSALTPVHLALMRQRKCDDYIVVDFGTNYEDEEFRRESMLRALTKLSRRASSHCNK